MKGVPKFLNWSPDLSLAPLGVKFAYSEKGRHACIPTKFEVRIFIHTKVMEGIPNFILKSRDPDHAHFRDYIICHPVANTC